MIDVSYRYSPKVLKGGKMMMDPDTGVETLVLPEPPPAPKSAPKTTPMVVLSEPPVLKPTPKPIPVVKKHAKA